MGNTGLFEQSDLYNGAILELHENPGGSGDTLRVSAGPRNDEPGAGVLRVHTDGKPLVKLVASEEFLGRLEAWSHRGRGNAEEALQNVRLFNAGCERHGIDRSGYLRLAAVNAEEDPKLVVRLDARGGEHTKGRLSLWDADQPYEDVFIALEIGDDGPMLRMKGPEGWIIISPTQVTGSPDKAEWCFVADHPTDSGLEIHYAVMEGPEVGVYVRGTATLSRGRAEVMLPSHFEYVASQSGLTVQLTPRSAASRGIAATSVSVRRIVIEELFDGRGEYDVDYVVSGVRKGRETFAVVRPKTNRDAGIPPADTDCNDDARPEI